MPELVYRVRFEIEKPDAGGLGDIGGGAAASGAQQINQIYETNINASKQYQSVIKQELNITNNLVITQRNLNKSRIENHKAIRDMVAELKASTLGLRENTTNINNLTSATNEDIASLNDRRNALLELMQAEELQNIKLDESHDMYMQVTSALNSAGGAVNTATSTLSKFGSQLNSTSEFSDNASEKLRGLISAIGQQTSEVRKYNAIAEARGSVDQRDIAQWTVARERVESLKDEIIELARSVNTLDSSEITKMNNALKSAGQASTSAQRYLSGMAGQMAGVNRLGNNVNQVMLSFGDALQDSAQFSYGFATGMRAVGNNLTFAAEQFSYAYQRAGSLKELMREFRGTLLGPVGIVVGINAAVTVITLFAQTVENRLKKVREEGTKTAEVYKQVASSFSQIGEEVISDPFGTRRTEGNLKSLRRQFGLMNDELADYLNNQKQIDAAGGIVKSFGPDVLRVFSQLSANIMPNINKQMNIFDLEIKAAFGDENAQRIIAQNEAYKELRKEIERLEIQQKAYDAFLSSNPVFKELDTTFKSISSGIQSANIQISAFGRSASTIYSGEYSKQIRSSIDSTLDQIRANEGNEEALSNLYSALGIYRGELEKVMRLEKTYYDAVRNINSIDLRRMAVMAEIANIEATGGSARQRMIAQIQQLNAEYEEQNYQISERYDQQKRDIILSEYMGLITSTQAAKQLDDLEKLTEAERKLADAKRDTATAQTEMNKLQEAMLNLQLAAQIAGQFGDAFNASKEFRIAMALVDAGAAIVSTMADTEGGPVAKIIASAAIAARTAKLISDMKRVEIGSGSVPESPAAFGFQMNEIEGPQTFRTPGYMPAQPTTSVSPIVDVQILANRRDLYAMVRMGEEEANATQVQ